MASTVKVVLKPSSPEIAIAPVKRNPTLYTIIIFKLAKGGLFFVFAVLLFFQATHNLPKEWNGLWTHPVMVNIFHNLRIHPENKFFQHIAEQIADTTPERIRWMALGTMAWSLFPLIEGVGLLFRAPWAGWLAIGESAFFVPIEVYELGRKFSWYLVLVTVVNILIVWYLFANRETLFRHHHHHS